MRYWPAFVISIVACASVAGRPASVGFRQHHTEQGTWQLDVAHNRFSGAVLCRLRSRDKHEIFLGGAVGFAFGKSQIVSGAVYRLDGDVVHTERDELPELIRLGAPIETGGMTNPTRGVVWIPFVRLTDVSSMTIQPSPEHRPKAFQLRGLKGLYELAQVRGCVPDGRFVE